MGRAFKLHQYCNDTFYAIVYSGSLPGFTLGLLKVFFEKYSQSIGVTYRTQVRVEGLGMFNELTDNFCNGRVKETCDHPLLDIDDETTRPWQQYDYVNKKHVDWFGPLMEKGEGSPEFKEAIKFSYKESFKSSLLAAGIPDSDTNNAYVFRVFDCRDVYETEPFILPETFLDTVPSRHLIKDAVVMT